MGAVGIAFGAVVSVLQYRAAFWQDKRASMWVALVLAFLGVMSLPVSLGIAGNLFNAREWPSPSGVPLLAMGPLFCILAIVNYAWARKHKDAAIKSDAGNLAQFVPRFRLKELLLVTGGISVVLAGLICGVKTLPVPYASHVSPEYAGLVLPRGASDVCVFRGYSRYIFYHFSVDEEGFWQWARSLEKRERGTPRQVKRIANEYKIETCSVDGSTIDYAIIHQGWFYDGPHERPPISFAYDERTGRAYYLGRENR